MKSTFSYRMMLLLLTISLFAVACTSSSAAEPAAEEMEEMGESMEEMEHDEDGDHEHDDHDDHEHSDGDHDHDDHDHGDSARIPNENGASIRIISPADGDTFSAGDDVVVEVEIANFTLGEDGNHWHVYDNGNSYGMVMGTNTSETLVALEPGMHEISAYLAVGSHEEFEDGATIMIMVEE